MPGIYIAVLNNVLFDWIDLQFQEILKPNYNSVDLAEVELVDSYPYLPEPRSNDSELLQVLEFISRTIIWFHNVILYVLVGYTKLHEPSF